MQTRSSGVFGRARWLVPAAALSLLGCPKQELAPLGPCTVSAVKEEVSQTGVSKVDLLFVIDNSASMVQEQKNLAIQLPRMVKVLTTGNRNAGRDADAPAPADGEAKDNFSPVSSLQLAVVTTDLAGATKDDAEYAEIPNCAEGVVNDGQFQSSTKVAVDGQVNDEGVQLIDPDSKCAKANPTRYQLFETTGDPAQADEDAAEASKVALNFSCVVNVGVLGCAYEQQLEAMWKSVAPSKLTDFVGASKRGHGNPDGYNAGFVRDDAILAVIMVTDEEDCSVTLAGRELFAPKEGTEWDKIAYNARCGIADGDADSRKKMLMPLDRYTEGLLGLKPDNPDRVIFGAIVGIPEELEGESPDTILADDAMQFRTVLKEGETDAKKALPAPSCVVTRKPGGEPEVAFPPRRIVEVVKGFGDNGVLFSICRKDYGDALDKIIDKIASKLSGNCLPRQLTPNEEGNVECEVWELLSAETKACSEKKHELINKSTKPESRIVREGNKLVRRQACKMRQIPVINRALASDKDGWYYDNFTEDTIKECTLPGEEQRINFTLGGGLSNGSGATFECFQSVASIGLGSAMGYDAINTNCVDDEGICAAKSNKSKGGYDLACIPELNSCQAVCGSDVDCPPGWACAAGEDKKQKYCQQPTCPQTK